MRKAPSVLASSESTAANAAGAYQQQWARKWRATQDRQKMQREGEQKRKMDERQTLKQFAEEVERLKSISKTNTLTQGQAAARKEEENMRAERQRMEAILLEQQEQIHRMLNLLTKHSFADDACPMEASKCSPLNPRRESMVRADAASSRDAFASVMSTPNADSDSQSFKRFTFSPQAGASSLTTPPVAAAVNGSTNALTPSTPPTLRLTPPSVPALHASASKTITAAGAGELARHENTATALDSNGDKNNAAAEAKDSDNKTATSLSISLTSARGAAVAVAAPPGVSTDACGALADSVSQPAAVITPRRPTTPSRGATGLTPRTRRITHAAATAAATATTATAALHLAVGDPSPKETVAVAPLAPQHSPATPRRSARATARRVLAIIICGHCQDHVAMQHCAACQLSLCAQCDADLHKAVLHRDHQRTVLYPAKAEAAAGSKTPHRERHSVVPSRAATLSQVKSVSQPQSPVAVPVPAHTGTLPPIAASVRTPPPQSSTSRPGGSGSPAKSTTKAKARSTQLLITKPKPQQQHCHADNSNDVVEASLETVSPVESPAHSRHGSICDDGSNILLNKHVPIIPKALMNDCEVGTLTVPASLSFFPPIATRRGTIRAHLPGTSSTTRSPAADPLNPSASSSLSLPPVSAPPPSEAASPSFPAHPLSSANLSRVTLPPSPRSTKEGIEFVVVTTQKLPPEASTSLTRSTPPTPPSSSSSSFSASSSSPTSASSSSSSAAEAVVASANAVPEACAANDGESGGGHGAGATCLSAAASGVNGTAAGEVDAGPSVEELTEVIAKVAKRHRQQRKAAASNKVKAVVAFKSTAAKQSSQTQDRRRAPKPLAQGSQLVRSTTQRKLSTPVASTATDAVVAGVVSTAEGGRSVSSESSSAGSPLGASGSATSLNSLQGSDWCVSSLQTALGNGKNESRRPSAEKPTSDGPTTQLQERESAAPNVLVRKSSSSKDWRQPQPPPSSLDRPPTLPNLYAERPSQDRTRGVRKLLRRTMQGPADALQNNPFLINMLLRAQAANQVAASSSDGADPCSLRSPCLPQQDVCASTTSPQLPIASPLPVAPDECTPRRKTPTNARDQSVPLA